MSIIYPPYIEGTLPAFANGQLKVPFQDNPAVAGETNFVGRITDIETNEIVFDSNIFGNNNENPNVVVLNFYGTAGKYYKVQIAYNGGSPYAYSTVGIAKCLGSAPSVSVSVGGDGIVIGKYTAAEASEPKYSYNFKVYKQNTLVIESGEKISSNSEDKFYFNPSEGSYEIRYIATSVNGYTAQAKTTVSGKSGGSASGDPQVDYDNGALIVPISTGPIWRLGNDDTMWHLISKNGNVEDNTVKQGVTYVYSNMSTKTNPIAASFENVFLSDKDRQLSIRFNEKISSFKENILETKIDTIGGQYPHFFRNGNVKYKEFQLSGLISYHMDNEEKFLLRKKIGIVKNDIARGDDEEEGNPISTGLEDYNIYAERVFREEVFAWLNNGKAKLFRSPTEGNFVVRLTGVSLSPEEKLGRMLYSFSCTAYEVMDLDYEKMAEAGVING